MAKRTNELKRLIAFLERNILKGGLATEEEIEAVAATYEEKRKALGGRLPKDDLYLWWAELRSVAKRDRKAKSRAQEIDALEVALACLEDRPVEVFLPSLGPRRSVLVRPPSYNRIQAVEDYDRNLFALEAARLWLVERRERGETIDEKGERVRPCDRCGALPRPGAIGELLEMIREEVAKTRAMLYALVTVPTIGIPTNLEPVDWADKITAAEGMLLLQAWHRVGIDRLRRLPEPVGEAGDEVPRHWSFLFSRQAAKDGVPVVEVMENRSLNSIVTVALLEGIRDAKQRKEAESKAKAPTKARSARATPRRRPRRGRTPRGSRR